MNFKKLSVAAALSIGAMTIGSMANADALMPAAPVAKPEKVSPAAPYYEEAAPAAPAAACPVPVAECPEGIKGIIPNLAPDAKVIKRQAFAFPSLGSQGTVIPGDFRNVQMGGEQEQLSAATGGMAGLAAIPQAGALTLMPGTQVGAAYPIAPACPTQVTLGTEILRCKVHDPTKILQTAIQDPAMTGAAIPMLQPQIPMGAAVPMEEIDQAGVPLGMAAPVEQVSPVYTQAGLVPKYPLGSAVPVIPQEAEEVPTGEAVPMEVEGIPTGFAAPACPGVPTGLAAELAGEPRQIETSSGIEIQKTVIAPVEITGAAAPAADIPNQFPDVNFDMLGGYEINFLASKGILAGFPDRTFKPNLPILRDELASALVSALELDNVPAFRQQIFTDVPVDHWAKEDIDKAFNRGLLAGFPDTSFKPDQAVTRAEALSAMAKVIPGDITTDKAERILEAYPDAAEIPGWAAVPIAESLEAGLLADLPDGGQIRPNEAASRAEIATMIKQLRNTLAMDPEVVPTGAATEMQPQVVSSTIPTLKMKFEDIVSARTNTVGDRVVAHTTESVNIDGKHYPEGSRVEGKVSEVIRPGLGEPGAIRIAFNSIGTDEAKTILPKEIISAVVVEDKNPNIVGRFMAWPFSWPGKVAGVAGRTVGGTAIIAGNMTEGFLTNIGNGTNELFNGKFAAAGRSYLMSGQEVGMGIYDTARTAFSGTVGVLKESGDEIAYVVSPDGARIAQINPNEVLSVAFGTY